VEILRERKVVGGADTHEAMRGAIADYFDQQGGAVSYRGVQHACDHAIRSDGCGGVAEALAFATMYNVSLEIHSPETLEYMQELDCGSPEAAPELLLQMLAWQDDGSPAPTGDHWQRLRKKAAAASSGGMPFKSSALTLSSDAAKKTHPKINNPQNFPLPLCGSVILKGSVFLEASDYCLCVSITI